MKKFLTLLIALCFTVQFLPAVTAGAEEQITITGVEDFNAFVEKIRAGETALNAVMTENVDLAGSAENIPQNYYFAGGAEAFRPAPRIISL